MAELGVEIEVYIQRMGMSRAHFLTDFWSITQTADEHHAAAAKINMVRLLLVYDAFLHIPIRKYILYCLLAGIPIPNQVDI